MREVQSNMRGHVPTRRIGVYSSKAERCSVPLTHALSVLLLLLLPPPPPTLPPPTPLLLFLLLVLLLVLLLLLLPLLSLLQELLDSQDVARMEALLVQAQEKLKTAEESLVVTREHKAEQEERLRQQRAKRAAAETHESDLVPMLLP